MPERRGVLRTLLATPLVLLALTSDGSRAKKRKQPITTFDGYPVFRWPDGPVTILDYGTETTLLADTIRDFQAYMPGVKLTITPQPPTPCSEVAEPRDGELVVCGDTEGWASGNGDAGRATVSFGEGGTLRAMVVCHELMHTLAGVPDDYEVRNAGTRDSCVHGVAEGLGAWDKALLTALYPPPKNRKRRR